MHTFLALPVNNVWILPVYIKFKIVLYFWSKHMWGQILRFINIYLCFIITYIFFAHASVCVWRMLTLVKESCDPCWYSKSSSYLHSLAWRDVMNHVYLQQLQSGPSCVTSSTHSMLGWVIPYIIFCCKILTKGFTLYSSLFYSLPPSPSAHLFPTTCFVRSHFIV